MDQVTVMETVLGPQTHPEEEDLATQTPFLIPSRSSCRSSNPFAKYKSIWKISGGHNQLILDLNGWGEWKAIGVGMYGGFVNVWFGHEADP